MTDIDRRDFLVQSAGALAAVSLVPTLGFAGMSLAAPVSVCVIGLGRQGRAIIAELGGIEGATIGAICDTDSRRLRAGARRARDAKQVQDAREVLDDPSIDAVCIATPTHQHRELAEAALGAGKHVYLEAPMAHTIEDPEDPNHEICRDAVKRLRAAKDARGRKLEVIELPLSADDVDASTRSIEVSAGGPSWSARWSELERATQEFSQ